MAWSDKIRGLFRAPNGNSAALAEPDLRERGVDTAGFIGPVNMPAKPVPAYEPKAAQQQSVGLSVDESVQGLPGTANLAGFVEDIGEYDPKLLGLAGIRVYQKMRRNDPTVAALELARTLPIRSAEWDVVEGIEADQPGYALAKELCQFAKENLFGGLERTTASGEKKTQTFESVIENALLSVLGCAAHEDIWEVDSDKGRVRLARLAPRLPDTFYQFVTEPDGETLYELIQFGYRGPAVELLPVKASKLAYFVLNREGANFYGRAIHRPCYTPWYFKQHLMKVEAVAFERNGMGIPWIQLGPNASDDDKKAAWQYASNLSVNERAALVTPNGYTAELLAVKGKVLAPRQAIQYYDQQILMSGLAAWLMLGQTSTGTRSVGSVQKDFYLLAEESFAQMIAETISSTSLRRLIDHNYRAKAGESLPYPKLVCSDIRMVELETVLDAVQKLASQNVDMLRPTPERDDAVAEMLGLPNLGKDKRGPRLAPVVTRQNLTDEVVEGTGEEISGSSSDPMPKAGEKRDEVAVENPAGKKAAPQQNGKQEPVQASEKQALRFAQSGKGPARNDRSTVSPFWKEGHDPALKMVHAREAHVDFPAHQAALDLAEQRIKQVLLRGRRKLLRQMAVQAAGAISSGKLPAAYAVPQAQELKSGIQSELQSLYQKSRQEMRAESDRLSRRQVLMADNTGTSATAADSDPTPLLAEIAAGRYTGELSNGVQRAANNLRTGSVTIADLPRNPDGSYDLSGLNKNELADLIWEEASGAGAQAGIPAISPNLEDSISATAARDTFRRGRSQEAQAIMDELARIGVKAQIIRVGILDKNICGPCEAADGKPWPLDIPVSSICEGGDLCRCEPIEVRE